MFTHLNLKSNDKLRRASFSIDMFGNWLDVNPFFKKIEYSIAFIIYIYEAKSIEPDKQARSILVDLDNSPILEFIQFSNYCRH